jgi:hypothetical protein
VAEDMPQASPAQRRIKEFSSAGFGPKQEVAFWWLIRVQQTSQRG